MSWSQRSLGIAPYVSIIRQFVRDHAEGIRNHATPQRFYVLHGVSYQDELVYDRELRAVGETHSHVIQYVPSISRPLEARNAGWVGAIGRVNFSLEEWLERWALPKDDTLVYLCGHPGMIEDAKARLRPQRWALIEAQYWPD